MTLQEEIQNNAGLEINNEYLSEGIRFFRNSSKMRSLGKTLEKKRLRLVKKNDLKNARLLQPMIDEIVKVSAKFETVEVSFRTAKTKGSKEEIKKEYAELEKSFQKLVDISKKDSTKKALIACGGVVLAAGVIALGIFGYMSLDDGIVQEETIKNLSARKAKMGISKMSNSDVLKNIGIEPTKPRSVYNTVTADRDNFLKAFGKKREVRGNLNKIIRNTNDSLMSSIAVAGATISGVIGVNLLNNLRSIGRQNKTVKSAVESIDGLKKSEKLKKTT